MIRTREKIKKAILTKIRNRVIKKEFKERWERIRIIILNRDNYICQKCYKDLSGVNPLEIKVYHIIPKQYKDLFFDEFNLLTLCSNCRWGKESPHQNALMFSEWFKDKFPERHHYLLTMVKRLE